MKKRRVLIMMNEVVLYDSRSDNLVTLQLQRDDRWRVRTALFPEGYFAEIDLKSILVDNDEYLTLGLL
jgi:hypothetical protein